MVPWALPEVTAQQRTRIRLSAEYSLLYPITPCSIISSKQSRNKQTEKRFGDNFSVQNHIFRMWPEETRKPGAQKLVTDTTGSSCRRVVDDWKTAENNTSLRLVDSTAEPLNHRNPQKGVFMTDRIHHMTATVTEDSGLCQCQEILWHRGLYFCFHSRITQHLFYLSSECECLSPFD